MSKPTHRHAIALSLAALACGLLTACGVAEAAGAPGTPAPVPAGPVPVTQPAAVRVEPTPAQATTSRPQLRLDSSPAEVSKLRHAYAGCLREHGMPSKGTWSTAAEKSARAACEHLRPLLPPELDPAKNPNYAKSVRIEAKCLQDHGFDVHLVKVDGPAKLGWRYASVPGPDVDIAKIQDDCRVKAYGGGRAIQPGPQ
ncbi:hypothetical protein GCM10010116_35250 [Microbispora rosea subsp. aerata]|nr:hypothetical protein [Microbispora rosea]GGO17425.1 hypothetical protein GCM10010116_35250 [Microbispora rosea subsp. aerata]GIH56539.1 hypothetical protein Mro02_34530 [Microbispora rosea subsp. aerata]GLJ81932.1 hypothetical protein GCM10017588_06570 [Microbispora rosea subsp. aerata]